MKTATIVASMFVGLLLGTTVAVANAGNSHSNAVAERRAMDVAAPAAVDPPTVDSVITLPEVTIHGSRKVGPKAPVKKAKVWTCSPWQDSYVGGRYQACEWK